MALVRGPPWLVNALARQEIGKISGEDRSQAITAQHVDHAAENIMSGWNNHLSRLTRRLGEPRARRIIEPMLSLAKRDFLADAQADGDSLNDDERYRLALGIVKRDGTPRPANPICASVISRHFGQKAQRRLSSGSSGQSRGPWKGIAWT